MVLTIVMSCIYDNYDHLTDNVTGKSNYIIIHENVLRNLSENMYFWFIEGSESKQNFIIWK